MNKKENRKMTEIIKAAYAYTKAENALSYTRANAAADAAYNDVVYADDDAVAALAVANDAVAAALSVAEAKAHAVGAAYAALSVADYAVEAGVFFDAYAAAFTANATGATIPNKIKIKE